LCRPAPREGPTSCWVVVLHEDETPSDAVRLPDPSETPPDTPVRSAARKIDREGAATGEGSMNAPPCTRTEWKLAVIDSGRM
jgi:hypothetical protein